MSADGSVATTAKNLQVAPTRSLTVIRQASELYSRVFGYSSRDLSLNPKLLLAIAGNGGSAIAATTPEGDLVGFAYGFAGYDGTSVYQYSQAAFVAPGMQGMGIGRRLKQVQAEHARKLGMTAMRWAYDPMLANNAHFNLGVLGARGRWFAPRLYDDDVSARLIVEWTIGAGPDADADAGAPATAPATLATAPYPVVATAQWCTEVDDPGATRPPGTTSIVVPIPAPASLRALDPSVVASLRFLLSSTISGLVERGFTATDSAIVDERSAAYRFTGATPSPSAPSLNSPSWRVSA